MSEKKSKKWVGKRLAEGEMTGHSHVVQFSDVYELENGVREFDVGTTGDVITHEEHKVIPVLPGNYVSDRVQEYDHPAEEAKKVQD